MKGSNVVITLQCPLGFLIGDRNYCCDRGTSSTRTRTLSEFVLLSGAPLGPTSLGPTSLRPFGFVRAKGGYPPAPLPPEGGGGATLRPSGGRPPLALLLGPTSGGRPALGPAPYFVGSWGGAGGAEGFGPPLAQLPPLGLLWGCGPPAPLGSTPKVGPRVGSRAKGGREGCRTKAKGQDQGGPYFVGPRDV